MEKESKFIFIPRLKVKKLEFLGSGAFGRCYKYNNTTTLKIYKTDDFFENMENFLEFDDTVVRFPRKIVRDSSKTKYGSLYKYAEGKPLYKCRDLEIKKLIEMYQILKEGVENMSREGIISSDISSSNIIIGDKPYLIDTDLYSILPKSSSYSLVNVNLYELFDTFYMFLIRPYKSMDIFINKYKVLQKMYSNYLNLTNFDFDIFLKTFIEILSNQTNFNINNIEDLLYAEHIYSKKYN